MQSVFAFPAGDSLPEMNVQQAKSFAVDGLGDMSREDNGPALHAAVRAAAGWLVDHQKPDGHWVGRAELNACMEAQWCLALWFRRPRKSSAAAASGAGDPGNAASRWRLGDLSRRAERRHQHDRRSLCRTALDRPPRRRTGACAGAGLDRQQGRPAQCPGVHPLLARVDGRMAVGKDPEHSAGSYLVSHVVHVLDL